MVNDSHPGFRILVIVVLSAATAGMAVVSVRANYLFGYGFGHTAEKAQILGWANVAADLWKIFGLVVITSLWRSERRRIAICLVPILLLCLAWGLVGAIGIYAQERTAVIDGREARLAVLRDAEQELSEIDTELNRIPAHRAAAELEAAIAAVLARPVNIQDRVLGTVGSLSGKCANTNRRTLDACAEVASLELERARAQAAAELRTRRDQMRSRVAELRAHGDARPPDPLADLLVWLSQERVSGRAIAFSFPLVFALLIEIVSAFGPAAIVAYADATRPRPPISAPEPAIARRGTPKPVTARNGAHEHVATWMAERTEPAASGHVSLADLHRDYAAWCEGNATSPLPLAAFRLAFEHTIGAPELGSAIQKVSRKYRGIKIIVNLDRTATTRRINHS